MADAAQTSFDFLATDASHFPQRLEPVQEMIRFIRMGPADYRDASFLDDRILTPQTQGGWVQHGDVERALAKAKPGLPLHFIFHAGHVGSTLISRLLDEAGALPLREPQTLRTLAEMNDSAGAADSLWSDARLDAIFATHIALWRRGFGGERAAILKATSSAARVGEKLLSLAPNARALCLNLKPEPYLATLLAGANSWLDLRGMGAERMRRMTRMLGDAPGHLHALSLGELAAMTWLCETLTQRRLIANTGARTLAIDFDAFLGDVSGSMNRIAAHFMLGADADFGSRAAASGALSRYSKSPDHAYSPQARAQILAETRAAHGGEIRRGLAWLEAVGARHGAAAAAL
ncbi:MAG: hypothetical protein AB7O04_13045 [Hyphomonadaceae bacterium]